MRARVVRRVASRDGGHAQGSRNVGGALVEEVRLQWAKNPFKDTSRGTIREPGLAAGRVLDALTLFSPVLLRFPFTFSPLLLRVLLFIRGSSWGGVYPQL